MDASVIITSFNHSNYIEQCLRSVSAQQTEKEIEIIWFDDASTDDTIEQGEKALRGCPFKVIRLHQKNNRRSKRIPSLLDKIEAANGRYIFWLEGDDFWIDLEKIETQTASLDIVPHINICFTAAKIVDEEGNDTGRLLADHGNDPHIFSSSEVIIGDGGFMPTVSLCIRRSVFNEVPNFLYEYIPVGDYPIQVLCSIPNGALFLPYTTSAYRENSNNSWTQTILHNSTKRVDFEIEFLELIYNLADSKINHKHAFEIIFLEHYKCLHHLATRKKDHASLHKAALIFSKFTKLGEKHKK